MLHSSVVKLPVRYLAASWAVSDGIVYPLTDCCEASGKGSANVDSGVVCRACYSEVSSLYGMGFLTDDPSLPVELAAQVKEA